MSCTSPIQQRDIRSAAKPFKRDRDSSAKWANGTRLAAGVKAQVIEHEVPVSDDEVKASEYTGGGRQRPGSEFRPMKQWSQIATIDKTHANKTKLNGHPEHDMGAASNRLVRKMAARADADDVPLSNSILDLLPTHANNTNPSVHIMAREFSEKDDDTFYSFDSTIASPTNQGRNVGLGPLVEKAMEQQHARQTIHLVTAEYEVLDAQGETTVLGRKRSPKQRATTNMTAAVDDMEDEGFTLIEPVH